MPVLLARGADAQEDQKETYANKVRIVAQLPAALPPATPCRWPPRPPWPANAQGKFWEMHDKLFENQRALDRASLDKYAQEIGLDMTRFKADLDTNRSTSKPTSSHGSSLPGGGMGTPTFFINGKKIAGAYPFEKFDEMIKAAPR